MIPWFGMLSRPVFCSTHVLTRDSIGKHARLPRRMPKSKLPMEWRRGPVLEPVGTLTMTRKMLLLVRAAARRADVDDGEAIAGVSSGC